MILVSYRPLAGRRRTGDSGSGRGASPAVDVCGRNRRDKRQRVAHETLSWRLGATVVLSRTHQRPETHAIDATTTKEHQTKLLAGDVTPAHHRGKKRRLLAAAPGRPLARGLLARVGGLLARGAGGGGVALLLLDLSLRTGRSRRRRRKDAGARTFFVAALASRAFWRAAFFAAS